MLLYSRKLYYLYGINLNMRNKNSPLITVSGPPASGTSTLCRNLKEELNYELINGGDIFRNIAKDKDLTLSELTELSEKDYTIDVELDTRINNLMKNHITGVREPNGDGLIIESRLAGWNGIGKADVSIYLTAKPEIRYERISNRTESLEELKQREKSERKRYLKYYGVDLLNTDIYDIILNTGNLSQNQTKQISLKAISLKTNSHHTS